MVYGSRGVEDQVKDGSQTSFSDGERFILLFGDVPEAVSRSLGRWGYAVRPLPDRSPESTLHGASALVVDGSRAGASELLRRARDLLLPSILIRAPRFLLGELHAGVIYEDYPGPEEIRRAVNRLVSCPPPGRNTPVPIEPFLTFLRERFGLVFPPRRSAEIREGVLQRMTSLRLPTASAYLERLLRSPPGDREPDHLLGALLVGETYLFRTPGHFDTLRTQKLPDFLERSPSGVLRAWSAGCSTGEEAYCLGALLLARLEPHQVEVLGTDVNRRALEVARQAVFSTYSQRETIPASAMRCFERKGGELAASGELKRRVRFQYLNLTAWADGREKGPEEEFDVIFCRNVLLYFDPEVARRVLRQLSLRLRPGGVLFLGPSETVLGGDTDLNVRAGVDCFFLERPDPQRAARAAPIPAIPRSPPPPPPQPLPRLRVEAPPWEKAEADAARLPDDRVTRGFQLMDEEDFAAARAEFEGARGVEPRAHGPRLGLLFLEANEGNYKMAEAGCQVLAEEGSTRAELFYLMGLLADLASQAERAERQFQRALFLDSNCYMARLKVAEMLQRRGDTRGAHREAQNLLEQLRKLAPGALVPLSGGMSREALEAFCLGLLSEEGAA